MQVRGKNAEFGHRGMGGGVDRCWKEYDMVKGRNEIFHSVATQCTPQRGAANSSTNVIMNHGRSQHTLPLLRCGLPSSTACGHTEVLQTCSACEMERLTFRCM